MLKPDGITVDFVPSSMRALIAHADLREKYPERRAKLFDTYKKVLADPEYIAKANKQGISADWLGPEKSLAQINAAYAILDRYKELSESSCSGWSGRQRAFRDLATGTFSCDYLRNV